MIEVIFISEENNTQKVQEIKNRINCTEYIQIGDKNNVVIGAYSKGELADFNYSGTGYGGIAINNVSINYDFLKINVMLNNVSCNDNCVVLSLVGKRKNGGDNYVMPENYSHVLVKDNKVNIDVTLDLKDLEEGFDLDLTKKCYISVYANNLQCYIEDFNIWRGTGGEHNIKLDSYSPIRINKGQQIYELIFSNNQVRVAKVIPRKILYLGNSLLLGWWNSFGMAATNKDNDFYSLVNKYISFCLSSSEDKLESDRLALAEPIEKAKNTDEWLENTLSPKLTEDMDLVIVQCGDNVSNAKNFQVAFNKLLAKIKEKCPNARIAIVATWFKKQDAFKVIIEDSKKYDGILINISDIKNLDPKYSSAIGTEITKNDGTTEQITEQGVASHPSDEGFKIIAQRIIEKLF